MTESMEYIPCNLCGSDNSKVVCRGVIGEGRSQMEKYKPSSNEVSSDRIVKCKSCGLVYVNPRFKGKFIVKGYTKGTDKDFISQIKGREITFRKHLRLIEKYSKKGKILDVGTAGGSFLHVAKKAGWDVYGIEPNKWLCDWCKKNYGINIKQGTLDNVRYPSNYFDVVTLWDVLEHVPNPRLVLKECSRILKKNGLLVINYPDIGSWISRLMGKQWVFFITVHLYYFTRRTISKMLSLTGFKVSKFKPHFQTLSLGYLVYRMKPYNQTLYEIGSKFVNSLKIGKLQIPYWLGQTLVLAKKVK